MSLAPCHGMLPDVYGSKAARQRVLTLCVTCPSQTRTACAQLGADSGETRGVWGGLDLSDSDQRAQLPRRTPERTIEPPSIVPEAGLTDPDAREISYHVTPAAIVEY